MLWLVSQGLSWQQASALAGLSRISGWRYGTVDREQGIEGLLAEQWAGPPSGLAPQAQTLEARFAEQPPHTVAAAADRIEQLTGVRRERSPVHQFLRNTLGLNWRRIAAIPCPPQKTSPSTARSQPNS